MSSMAPASRPGSVVAVEALGYRPAWEALKLSGAKLVPVALDAQGVSVDALGQLTERERVAAFYTTPHHQYPTTVTLSAPRRLALLALARKKRFVIIEDDYDHEHHYEGRPILSLASVDSDVVAYIGTLSKVLAPGLRLGYLAARQEIIDRAVRARTYVDRQGDLSLKRAVVELIEDDLLGRHLRRVRREYQARRDALVQELLAQLGGGSRSACPRRHGALGEGRSPRRLGRSVGRTRPKPQGARAASHTLSLRWSHGALPKAWLRPAQAGRDQARRTTPRSRPASPRLNRAGTLHGLFG